MVDVTTSPTRSSVGLGAILAQVDRAEKDLADVNAWLQETDLASDDLRFDVVRTRLRLARSELNAAKAAAGSPVANRLNRPTMLGRLVEGATGLVAAGTAWLIGLPSGWTIAAGVVAGVLAMLPLYKILGWLDTGIGTLRSDELIAVATAGDTGGGADRLADLAAVRSVLGRANRIVGVAAMSYLGRSPHARELGPGVRMIRLATLDRVLSRLAWAELQLNAAIAVLDECLDSRG